ncbi:MAG: hypothetical protein ACI9G1_005987 [Pirellulaceae bacterium]|jgi:hypothetical protein
MDAVSASSWHGRFVRDSIRLARRRWREGVGEKAFGEKAFGEKALTRFVAQAASLIGWRLTI